MFILVQALVSESWGPLETGSGKVLITDSTHSQAEWSHFKFCLF